MLQIFGEKITRNTGSILLNRFEQFSGYLVTIFLKIYYNNNYTQGMEKILEILHGDKYRLKQFNQH